MSREDNLYMAKICEQTERFEDMVSYMKLVVSDGANDLSIEERNLLSVAYKNAIGPHRTAWRALSSILAKESEKGGKQASLIVSFKQKIEGELDKFCLDIIALLDNKLIPSANSNEANVFYLKMNGDYHRYVAEYATGDARAASGKSALQAYSEATKVANEHLKTTHPIRLGLALNSSVFHYEVMDDPTKACQLAKNAFDEAIADIEELEDDLYKDSTTIMQLIRDNLTLWTSELEQEEDDQ